MYLIPDYISVMQTYLHHRFGGICLLTQYCLSWKLVLISFDEHEDGAYVIFFFTEM